MPKRVRRGNTFLPAAPSCCGRTPATSKNRPAGALPKESIGPKRQFLRMASSDFLDSRKGCLWKSSLPCIKNRRFRGAVHFGRAVWDERCAKKPGNPDGLPGFFECVKRQNCQPKTSVFLRQRTQCQSGPHARLDGFCTKQAPVRTKAAAPEGAAAFLCFFSCA